MIIDAHVHLDLKSYPDPDIAGKELLKEMDNCGITLSWVINNPFYGCGIESLIALKKRYNRRFKVFTYLDIARSRNIDKRIDELISLGVSGFKFHPRLQKFSLNEPLFIKVLTEINGRKVPVIIDCFPDETSLANNGFGAAFLGDLAKKFHDINFIAAHAGGRFVLDFMKVSKNYKNIYMDISYTLTRYQNSPTFRDIANAINILEGKKIIYGSDYPSISLGKSLKDYRALLGEKGICKEYLENILYSNAEELLGV